MKFYRLKPQSGAEAVKNFIKKLFPRCRNDFQSQFFSAARNDDFLFLARPHFAKNKSVILHVAHVAPGELDDFIACFQPGF